MHRMIGLHCRQRPLIEACISFSFSGVSFSTKGNRGRSGPIQEYTIQRTGRYLIRAAGARGGTHRYNYGYATGTYYGGKGAVLSGTFRLVKGTVLKIVVGQRGGDSVEVRGGQATTQTAAALGLSIEYSAGTGGGGGSFVYASTNTLLIAAGGGGGSSSGYNGVDGQAGTSGASSVGTPSGNSRAGGSAGQPGVCNNPGNYHGGVGAGWLGQGCSRERLQHGERGGSRGQGWVGGQAGQMNSGNNGGPSPGAVGGFGGGGGGSEGSGASGGGGGYSGGGSGTHNQQAGGGGGSYCGGEGCSGVTGGNNPDDGFVKITEQS